MKGLEFDWALETDENQEVVTDARDILSFIPYSSASYIIPSGETVTDVKSPYQEFKGSTILIEGKKIGMAKVVVKLHHKVYKVSILPHIIRYQIYL